MSQNHQLNGAEYIVGLESVVCSETGELFVNANLYHIDLWDSGVWPQPEGGRGTFGNPTQDEVINMVESLLSERNRNLTIDDVAFVMTDVSARYSRGERPVYTQLLGEYTRVVAQHEEYWMENVASSYAVAHILHGDGWDVGIVDRHLDCTKDDAFICIMPEDDSIVSNVDPSPLLNLI